MAAEEEAVETPTGRLRAGYVRVAGVATVEAYRELERLRGERELPTISKALGVALEAWLETRRSGVTNPGRAAEESESRDPTDGILSEPPEPGGSA